MIFSVILGELCLLTLESVVILGFVYFTTSSVYLLKRGSKMDLGNNHDIKGAMAIMEKNAKYSEIKPVKTSDN